MPTALKLAVFVVVGATLAPQLWLFGYLVQGISLASDCPEDEICDGTGLVFVGLIVVFCAMAFYLLMASPHLYLAAKGSVKGVGWSGIILAAVDFAYGGIVLLFALPGPVSPVSLAVSGLVVVLFLAQLGVTVYAYIVANRSSQG